VKSFHDEEARVSAHEPSKTHPALCGALSLATPDGRRFSCGSGMTDKDRRSPPTVCARDHTRVCSFAPFVPMPPKRDLKFCPVWIYVPPPP